MKILLAEDEIDLARAQVAMLEHTGYSVDHARNGMEAVELAGRNAYDVLVMDIMMPVMDGITALKKIRAAGDTTPALFLTAKSGVDDRVEGLDAGADDYLTKPFAMKELLARIRSMTRRMTEYASARYEVGDLFLDTETAELRSVNSVILSAREAKLMELLMVNRDKSLGTEDIFARIWSDSPDASADSVWVYVSFLRGKLRSIGSRVSIEGEKGESYILRDRG